MRSEIIRLHISFQNPKMIKMMLPELAARRVSGMRFAAILTECQVGAGFSIGGRGGQRDPAWSGPCSKLQEHGGCLHGEGQVGQTM